MNLITISRGTLSGAKELAEKLSHKTGFPLVVREEIIAEAEERYNIRKSGIADMTWIDRPPSILERQSFRSKHYILSFQTIMLERAMKGSMIYLGHFGQFMFAGIPFLFRARFLRPEHVRIKHLMETDNLSEEKASIQLRLIDDRRRKWAELLYGVNIEDGKNYDLILNNESMGVETAANIIFEAIKMPEYNSKPGDDEVIRDLYLGTKAKLNLYLSPLTRGYEVEVNVSSQYETAKIKLLETYLDEEIEKFESHAKWVVLQIDGIREISLV